VKPAPVSTTRPPAAPVGTNPSAGFRTETIKPGSGGAGV
jgi:hypothetical protein